MPGEWDWMNKLPFVGGQQAPTQDASGLPQDDAMMQLELQRRMKFADALRNQAAPEGQMVSGHYVAPAWTQQLANLANKYVGGKTEENVLKQYGQYVSDKQLKQANALRDLSGALKPVAETTQGSYAIQVPNGQPAGPTDNLGGMQPYQSGMKSIDVPMTTQTGTIRQPTADEITAAIGKYSSAIHDPALLEKVVMGQVSSALSPKQYDWKTVGDTAFQVDTHGQTTGKTIHNPKETLAGSLEKDYLFAKGQGYKGSIEDFKRIPSSWINPYQQKELGLKEQADNPLGLPKPSQKSDNSLLNPPSNLPKVGASVNGFVYKGGNPNDPTSWSKQ